MPLEGNILGVGNFWARWRSTDYAEKEGSPEASLYFDRGQLMRHIYVAHENVDQALLDFAGDVTVVDNGIGRSLSRTIPHQYPKRPWMYVQGINSVQPHAMRARDPSGGSLIEQQARDIDDTTLYKYAEVGLQYAMPPYFTKQDDDIRVADLDDPMNGLPDEGAALAAGHGGSRWVSKHVKRSGKMLTIPRGLLRRPDNKLILEAIAINEHVAEYIYTWYQVPHEALPEDTWLLGANTVNDAVFDGRPAGTLLFSGEPELKLNPNPITGKLLYDVTYHLHSICLVDDTVEPNVVYGHNYIRQIDPGDNKMKPMLFSATGGAGAGGGARIYRNFDFKKLFRPDPL